MICSLKDEIRALKLREAALESDIANAMQDVVYLASPGDAGIKNGIYTGTNRVLVARYDLSLMVNGHNPHLAGRDTVNDGKGYLVITISRVPGRSPTCPIMGFSISWLASVNRLDMTRFAATGLSCMVPNSNAVIHVFVLSSTLKTTLNGQDAALSSAAFVAHARR